MDLRLWQARFRDYLIIVKQWSPRTAETYGRELKPFFEFLQARRVASPAGISRALLEEYRTELFYTQHRGKSLSFSTQGVRFSAVKRLLASSSARATCCWTSPEISKKPSGAGICHALCFLKPRLCVCSTPRM